MSLAVNVVAVSALFALVAFALTRGCRSAGTRHAIWTAALFATPIAAAIVAAIPVTRVVTGAPAAASRWPATLWLIGTTALLIRLAASYVRLTWLKHASPGSSIIFTAAVRVPQFAGYLRPAILVPAHLAGDPDLPVILAHEAVHARRYHDVLRAIQELIVALFFFSPLIHWLARRADFERELVADAEAARVTGGARAYGEALARIALGMRAEALAPAMRSLPRRVRALLDATDIDAPTQPLRLAAAAIAAIALLMLASPLLAHRVRTIVDAPPRGGDADTDALAHYGSGMSLYRGGHYREAAREFRAAFERGYDPAESARGVAESFAAAGDDAGAAAWRVRVPPPPPARR